MAPVTNVPDIDKYMYTTNTVFQITVFSMEYSKTRKFDVVILGHTQGILSYCFKSH